MVACATADVHKVKEWVGLGWWRRRATVDHVPVWIVVAFAADGSKLEGCRCSPGCIESRVGRVNLSLGQ